MPETNSISPDERIILEFCVHRMATSAFGSLATVPLFCLRELSIPDVHEAINERYDAWHSLLVVVCEVLRTKPGVMEGAKASLDALFRITVELRDAYGEISEFDELPAESVLAAYGRLRSSFNRIGPCVEDLGKAIDVNLESVSKWLKGWRRYYDNNLNWMSDTLQAKLMALSAENLSPFDSKHSA